MVVTKKLKFYSNLQHHML